MPSTRLMPVVMTSSLHVWSRLALEILFSPMSVQYTVSLPVKEREKIIWYVAITALHQKQAHQNMFLLHHLTKCALEF